MDKMVILFLVFFRNIHAVIHSGCTDLHFYQQCQRVPFPLHPVHHLLFAYFLMMAILASVCWYHV